MSSTTEPALMFYSHESMLILRREKTFLMLSGFFLCSMTLLNVIGITRFIELGPMNLAVGVLPYPLTFLCTDLVCELYGKRRANAMVTVGLIMNVFIFACLSLSQLAPAVPLDSQPPWQNIHLAKDLILPSGEVVSGSVELFYLIYSCTSGALFASMIAYIAAQYCDVQLFHFWKNLTQGKHLWLRNNFSTLMSQMVDSILVIGITFGAAYFAGNITLKAIFILMGSNYVFKMSIALLDTLPFYGLVFYFRKYLQLEANETVP